MFNAEMINAELIEVKANRAHLIEQFNTWDDVTTNLWKRVEELEQVEAEHEANDYDFNRKINQAYEDYDGAYEIFRDLDRKIEEVEEIIDHLIELKKLYE